MYINNIEHIEVKPFGGTIPYSHQIICSYRENGELKKIVLCMDEYTINNLVSELNKYKPSFVHENPLDYIK